MARSQLRVSAPTARSLLAWAILAAPTSGSGLLASSDPITVCSACAFDAIQAALDAAPSFAIVEVAPGLHRVDRLRISKPVLLRARAGGSARPILDGGERGDVITIRSDDVTLAGFEVRGAGRSEFEEFAAIRAVGVRRCAILENKLSGNAYGIVLEDTRGCAVRGNELYGRAVSEIESGDGIALYGARETSVAKNSVHGHRDGIYLDGATGCIVGGNDLRGNLRYGAHFMFASFNRLSGNRFDSNSTGVALMYSRGLEVAQNSIAGSRGQSAYGLLVKEVTESSFSGNSIAGNSTALFLDGAARNAFLDNRVASNGWGLKILGSAAENSFQRNSFAGNMFDVATNTREANNDFANNFWSRYDGYDLDGDGVGDRPHRPAGIFAYWVERYAVLILLLDSPVAAFLEIAERAFPVVTPIELADRAPLMKEIAE